MLRDWRGQGYGPDVLEVWAVGLPVEPIEIKRFAAGSSAPCLVDEIDPELSAFSKFRADRDALVVIDPSGWIRLRTDVYLSPLNEEQSRADLEDVVLRLVDPFH